MHNYSLVLEQNPHLTIYTFVSHQCIASPKLHNPHSQICKLLHFCYCSSDATSFWFHSAFLLRKTHKRQQKHSISSLGYSSLNWNFIKMWNVQYFLRMHDSFFCKLDSVSYFVRHQIQFMRIFFFFSLRRFFHQIFNKNFDFHCKLSILYASNT